MTLETTLPISTFSLAVPPEKTYNFRAFQFSECTRVPGTIESVGQYDMPAWLKDDDGTVDDLMFGIFYKIVLVNYVGKSENPDGTIGALKISLPYDEYVNKGKPQSLTVKITHR
ncbi:MAG TPA: hypothetical protein VJK72_03395 [Candidatus Nanoarchaeia archaeon]|nr:hypothetical protein [Candidatus Nanoarchaeia archaeon]